MEQKCIDRVAITIVDGNQANRLLKGLSEESFSATKVDAVGGFLQDALVTLLIGMPQTRLPRFYELVRLHCPARAQYVSMNVEMAMAPSYPMMIEARVGGATVFVLPVEKFVQL